jgi:hypothetical protein
VVDVSDDGEVAEEAYVHAGVSWRGHFSWAAARRPSRP